MNCAGPAQELEQSQSAILLAIKIDDWDAQSLENACMAPHGPTKNRGVAHLVHMVPCQHHMDRWVASDTK